MGKIIALLLGCLMLLPSSIKAQKYVNFDYKTAAQVTANTGAMAVAETEHNVKLDSIKKKQEKLMALVGTLASYKWLFQLTLENAKGFGMESGIYKTIVKRMADIAKRTGTATEALMATNFHGKAISAFKIYELGVETAHLGNVFFNVVCNGTVKNPVKMKESNEETDKLNLLNRHERLNLALSIKNQLDRIERQLMMVEYYCRHNSFEQLLAHIDRNTYVTYVYGRMQSKNLLERWNGLSK